MRKQGQQINDHEFVCRCQPACSESEPAHPPVQGDCLSRMLSYEPEKLKLAGLLAGSITHDLNNPLCGVHSVLERFSRRSDLADPEQHLLRLALQQCERMKLLLQDVQEFLYASSLEQSLFDLGSVLTTVLRLMHKQLKLSKMVVHPLIGQEPIMLMGYKDQIKLMLLQLFAAICRRLDGSRCEMTLSVRREGAWLRMMWQFQVARGDALGDLEHLLTQLVQTDGSLDGEIGVVQAVVQLHGGTIHLPANVQGPEAMVLSLPIK